MRLATNDDTADHYAMSMITKYYVNVYIALHVRERSTRAIAPLTL